MIEVDRLVKAYEDRIAVDELTFHVEPGEVLGLVGPNGAGKTTTLRAIAGIHPPTSGVVRIAGSDVVRDSIAAKTHLAHVPDDPQLWPSLTVWEHLAFTAQVYRVADFESAARALLETFELADRKETMADELSRGMRQKVAVACALLHEPRALMLDEPMTGLDPRGQRTLTAAVQKAAETGAAVIISSHQLGQVEQMCNRFLILSQGRSLFFGGRSEITRDLPGVRDGASLEEVFFEITEGRQEDLDA